jgi:hypothetical protein
MPNISLECNFGTNDSGHEILIISFDASNLNESGMQQAVAGAVNQMSKSIQIIENQKDNIIRIRYLDKESLDVTLFDDNILEATCRIIDTSMQIVSKQVANSSQIEVEIQDLDSVLPSYMKDKITEAFINSIN